MDVCVRQLFPVKSSAFPNLKVKQILVSISLWHTQHSFAFILLRFFFFLHSRQKKKDRTSRLTFSLFLLLYFTLGFILSLLSSFLSKDLECIVTPAGAVTTVELYLIDALWALGVTQMTQTTVSILLPLIAWPHLASEGWPQSAVFMPTMARPRNLGL